MPKKKPLKGKPAVHPELEGLDLYINELGEITGTFDLDKINEFLDRKVEDKKLKGRRPSSKKDGNGGKEGKKS